MQKPTLNANIIRLYVASWDVKGSEFRLQKNPETLFCCLTTICNPFIVPLEKKMKKRLTDAQIIEAIMKEFEYERLSHLARDSGIDNANLHRVSKGDRPLTDGMKLKLEKELGVSDVLLGKGQGPVIAGYDRVISVFKRAEIREEEAFEITRGLAKCPELMELLRTRPERARAAGKIAIKEELWDKLTQGMAELLV